MSPKKIGSVVFTVGALAIVAYSIWPDVSGLEGPSGSLRATGKALGDWTMAVSGCASGQRHGFSGVILFDDDSPREIRVIRTPRGETEIIVHARPGTKPIVIDTCKTADVQIQRTGSSLNGHYELEGSVKLDCSGLSGTVTFPSCY